MNIKNYIYKIFNTSPHKLIKKVIKKIHIKIKDKKLSNYDFNNESRYIDDKYHLNHSYIDIKDINVSNLGVEDITYLCEKYLNHEFDLLGSGWVKADYSVKVLGVEGKKYSMSLNIKVFDEEGKWLENILLKPYLSYSKHIWKQIDKSYKPIDWQMDFKSGYRFNQKNWYKKQPIGTIEGMDIKVPWELSRMQHLVQMAVFSLELPECRDDLIREFKNQVLDFIMTNPTRMGCNWTCTMDVAIRVANMLLAYDIFKQIDENNILDEYFQRIFSNSIYHHGKFIVNNLEWSEDMAGNHYLSDIIGLLFVASYINRTEETDAWLVFAIQELIESMDKQFYEDGSNFESSTSYHRLSGELMIFGTAITYGILKTDKIKAFNEYNYKLIKRLTPLSKQRFNLQQENFFPDWYLQRLYRSAYFTYDITKPNGNIPQIGDNDSGRFFKFTPVGEFITTDEAVNKYSNLKGYKNLLGKEIYWDENGLKHGAFISSVSALFYDRKFEDINKIYPLEKSIIESISKGINHKITIKNTIPKIEKVNIPNLIFSKHTEIIFSNYNMSNIELSRLKFISYSNFGLYIFKTDKFYLSIMAGPNGQNGNAGHTNNDKLSFELNLNEKDIFVDPGTYLYTPIPNRRNEFRSVKVHNVPIVKGEEQNTCLTLFSMKDETKCHVLSYTNNSIKIYLNYRDVHTVREFKVCADRLIIQDSCNKDFTVNLNEGEVYSNGYGKLKISRDCHLPSNLEK